MIYIVLYLLNVVFAEKINNQPLSTPRFYFSSTSLQNKGIVLFAGGFINPDYQMYDIVDIFNASSNSWTTAQLSVARYLMASTSIDSFNMSFFAGGTTSALYVAFTSAVDIYNGNTNIWSTAKLSSSRTTVAATSLNKQGLAFFGGGSNYNEIGTVDIYNAFTNSWTTATLSIPRDSLIATSLEFHGLAFFAGGDGAIGQTFSTVDVYNGITNKWSVMQLSVNRTNLAAAALPYQGIVMFAGGTLLQSQSLPTDIVDIYNATSNTWTTAKLATPTYFLSGTSLPKAGLIFFGGGYSSILGYSYVNEPVNIVNIFNISDGSWQMSNFSKEYQTFAATFLDNYNLAFFAGFEKPTNESPLYIFSTCNAGFYNNTLTTDKQICKSCNIGTYSFESSTECISCPPGYFCQSHFTKPEPALPGCFNPQSGSVYNCDYTCDIGNYCPGASIQQTLCPQGTYCDVSKLGSPIKCPSGTYNQNIGSTTKSSCKTCPGGTYCSQDATNTIPCPAQYYCPEGSINYIPCKPGYYCPFATNNLLPCPSGSYCPEMSSVPMNCPAGAYCPQLSIKPISCQGGYQCPSGSNQQIICPKGTYSLPGSGECTACQNGEFTFGPGASECQTCPVSRVDFNGWFCMTEAQKLVFAGGWILSIFSICLTNWKIYRWLRYRRKKLIEYDVQVTLRNIFFYKKSKTSIPLLNKTFFDESERMKYLEEMILDLKAEVDKLKSQ